MSRPSDFAKVFPCMSVFGKAEAESVAQNIMKVLENTGDTFRELCWGEYVKEKEGKINSDDRWFFKEVVKYCETEEAAREFAVVWWRIVRNGRRACGGGVLSRGAQAESGVWPVSHRRVLRSRADHQQAP